MVPLHHRTKLTKSGENSTSVPPPTKRGGGGVRKPNSKIASKKERRYNKRNSLCVILHGRDVSDCPLSNMGKHRQGWRTKNCDRHSQYRRGGKRKGGEDGAGGKHNITSSTGLSCWRPLLQIRVSVILQDHAVRLPSGRP